MDFSWNSGNIDHIARHHITPDEVEQVVRNRPIEIERYLRNGEERWNSVGETDAGRVLVVVTTIREDRIRVVTAHPADRTLRALYARWKESKNARRGKHT